ncbi:hypothetical protein A3H10_03820 [Candidatus Uhrbacteria bacterium RIFCSPLOWO2_12_FULL_46_10]|uniref:5'-deoxynucleotidase n=1 Tax=Candidatus Uhrbacteria bacterium RIFCSPLOWO2_01_FULL_47_25 TaxID=1802402 RepID=A0A1F7UTJ7_9BACT|nr:MAG: Metal dependent phosphohydrolase [Parcubacteria group bacterium GW2011_GWA2_46_9]OGL60615.1 MAG: hypothetical protein A2752_02190 [Candidatus Uhrbacteria bacterium RIFCSPHIGHO2_01_FULL_46_23]OGL68146.1 MAG: hypothetical protein A3D60_04045 [Candidatus Uhrbacteria bacterium RIFCSPHIGHO2_02_FULL_47_29]OGL74810.1 MAG: hypothetical protein A3E96_04640 [Candidatus Uhrbacteria bacterium RIFCSPHIGHO2_12_FULL_46_13]OGL80997.1 MAG: hypothetical protein A2936_03380 [Candidatus Uhrbacteria bacteri
MSTPRDLELLFEIGSLRHVCRGWRQHLGTDCANDLEHTVRVAFLALALARQEGAPNEELILKMALTHDIAETRVSDHSYIQKVYVETDEARAAHDMFSGTILADLKNIIAAFESRQSIEAKIVKDTDNLDIDLELKELEETGHQLPEKWRKFRRLIRDEKFYTASAKKMWDEIQEADPSSWHIAANKWMKIPDAGK